MNRDSLRNRRNLRGRTSSRDGVQRNSRVLLSEYSERTFVYMCERVRSIDRAKEYGEADWVSPCLGFNRGIAACPVINPRKFFVSSFYTVVCCARDHYGARGKNLVESPYFQIKIHFSKNIGLFDRSILMNI